MWFESQNCAMMGVQVTAGKRKLETASTAGSDLSPAKTGRWEPIGAEDCIARLQAVAIPGDAWRPTPIPAPATTLLSVDEFDDDDDFDDELSDDGMAPDSLRYAYDYQHQASRSNYTSAATATAAPTWQYYAPPVQQTIRCEENGKSYLELGAVQTTPTPPVTTSNMTSSSSRARCCDGRTRWCNVPCYRQRRLAVLNLSMCKLSRYRQCSDPSLRRSVLICNTLRHIEREMEAEGQQPQQPPPPPPPPPDPCYTPCYTSSLRLTPVAEVQIQQSPLDPYEYSLREFAVPSGRATPFPGGPNLDTDSGIGDDDSGRTINWGSVLSLTSQTDLEPLNNNELYAELGLTTTAATTVTTTTTINNNNSSINNSNNNNNSELQWDSFMHVLVGGS